MHNQAPEMKRILDRHGIQWLYHFTAIDNLPVIAECMGLWSKERLEQAGLLDRIITGGNELSLQLDRRLGNWDKVHLYFCPKTPMAYRKQQNPEDIDPQSAHICYLIIDPTVAQWDGVVFTDTNATASEHERKQGLEGLELIDFDTIRSHLNDRFVEPRQRWHRNVQAECLVPDEIPLNYVSGILFISQASLKEGQRLWGDTDHPPFSVDEDLFQTGFPWVKDFILTSQEVTRENVHSALFRDKRNFSKSLDSRITLLTSLYPTAGVQAKVIWLDNSGDPISESQVEFEKQSSCRHWHNEDIMELDEGDYSIEYYLCEIRWFNVHFKVGG